MFEYERTADRLTVLRPATRWLSNGFDGGYRTADAAHNLTVPEGFERTDLATFAAERLGSLPDGPTLLTGVEQTNARGARCGPIEAIVTAGLSNPAMLPVDEATPSPPSASFDSDAAVDPGTVNVLLGSNAPLIDGGLAGLLATAVEAKTATLLKVADCTGTTSDAVVVGCPNSDDGSEAAFAGSATEIGNAARVCVRDAVLAALSARYDELSDPRNAEFATVASGDTTVFEP